MVAYCFSGLKIFPNAGVADAQAIGEALDEIERKVGRVTPESMLDAAADPQNELHKHANWDDKECGRQVRLGNMRAIQNVIYIRPEGVNPTQSEPRAISLKVQGERSYVATVKIKSKGELQRLMLEEELAFIQTQLQSFQDKYATATDD